LDALSFVSRFLTDIRRKVCMQFLFQMVYASVVSDLPSLFWGWLLCLSKYCGM